jgi:hypothetical protein
MEKEVQIKIKPALEGKHTETPKTDGGFNLTRRRESEGGDRRQLMVTKYTPRVSRAREEMAYRNQTETSEIAGK